MTNSLYARFGHVRNGEFREEMGTKSFYQFDRRYRADTIHADLIDYARFHGYDGFQYYTGSSVRDAKARGCPTIIN